MNIQQTASTPKLVTMIPADPQMTERDIRNKHLRIAPYCRVALLSSEINSGNKNSRPHMVCCQS